MRTLIVPCVGKREICNIPLFLAEHPENGMLLLEKVLTGIFPESYERIIVTVHKSINKKYNINEWIKTKFWHKYPIEVLALDEYTSGPADTVYETIIRAGVEGEFYVKDAHSFLRLTKMAKGNVIGGLDLTTCEETVENLREKSFIVINEQRNVLDIIEKKFRSDVISAGFYGFKSAEDYKLAYVRLKDVNYSIEKLYLSHIISYLIGYKNQVFHCDEIYDFEDWSTMRTWEEINRKYVTYFLDLELFFGDEEIKDLNSVVLNRNKVDVSKSMRKLQKLSNSGARFIFCTVKQDVNKELIIKYFLDNGVNCLTVVAGSTKPKSILDALKWGEL